MCAKKNIDLENRTKKLLNEISQLKENLVSLSEKNTELISELEMSQSNKMKIHKVSFHSYEQRIFYNIRNE